MTSPTATPRSVTSRPENTRRRPVARNPAARALDGTQLPRTTASSPAAGARTHSRRLTFAFISASYVRSAGFALAAAPVAESRKAIARLRKAAAELDDPRG